ncbi:MAG: glycyl-radical enzyme activating protein [Anaerovoracaceae bacterium]|jgi:pyruvate formate lyase activating enzyme
MIFNIQKCSIHDGDGLRTLVFFKGCPLHCPWCANPESQTFGGEIMENPSLCIGCGACVRVCPNDAIGPDMKIDRKKCKRCFKCVDVCYAEAKKLCGRRISTEDLFEEINKDRNFYKRLGGGVTFSGGEPLSHPLDLTAISKMCQEHHITVGLESCGVGSYKAFSRALPYIDFMFLDIKQIDPVLHRQMTGLSNREILKNIRRISDYGIPITIRTPVVPGCTDQDENIEGIAEVIRTLPTVKEYELLPYHRFGVGKYEALGRDYSLPEILPPSDERMRELVRKANRVLDGSGKVCFWTKNNTREELRYEDQDEKVIDMTRKGEQSSANV